MSVLWKNENKAHPKSVDEKKSDQKNHNSKNENNVRNY